MYPDGVWFVDLAPLAADAPVPAAIAGVLGLRQEPGRPFADTVSEYLSSRHALLVLDNCEHLADAAGTIVDQLLRTAPGVHVLATSRERLGVPGETAWTVLPLAEPGAVRLFVDRARSAAPAASVDGDPAVIEVCRRFDGVPLAIELAAARASVLPVGQIASRLDDALRLLGEASRTAPLRQRTLRATIRVELRVAHRDRAGAVRPPRCLPRRLHHRGRRSSGRLPRTRRPRRARLLRPTGGQILLPTTGRGGRDRPTAACTAGCSGGWPRAASARRRSSGCGTGCSTTSQPGVRRDESRRPALEPIRFARRMPASPRRG